MLATNPHRPDAAHDRYRLCGDDCTTDCGACKGAGRPMAAPAEQVTALLDQLEAAHAAGDSLPWGVSACSDCKVLDQDGLTAAATALPDDAALIVAAVNAIPTLLRLARERHALERALLDLADDWDRNAAIFPEYGDLSAAAARSIRDAIATALAGQHTTDEEAHRG